MNHQNFLILFGVGSISYFGINILLSFALRWDEFLGDAPLVEKVRIANPLAVILSIGVVTFESVLLQDWQGLGVVFAIGVTWHLWWAFFLKQKGSAQCWIDPRMGKSKQP